MTDARAIAARIDAVVIGASAGGVEAVSLLLPALSDALRAAVFIVLHQPRERHSLLPALFQRKCAWPLHEAVDKQPIATGNVYLAPPDYHLLVDRGPCIALSADEPVHFSRPSIDVLFESAADLYGERLLGIVLTGANEDGAAGLASVAAAGGVTVVQRPDTAQASTMPAAALRRIAADFVLPLAGIAGLLAGTRGHGPPP